jgi:hypothetical protein
MHMYTQDQTGHVLFKTSVSSPSACLTIKSPLIMSSLLHTKGYVPMMKKKMASPLRRFGISQSHPLPPPLSASPYVLTEHTPPALPWAV